jgi:hypothetical protein
MSAALLRLGHPTLSMHGALDAALTDGKSLRFLGEALNWATWASGKFGNLHLSIRADTNHLVVDGSRNHWIRDLVRGMGSSRTGGDSDRFRPMPWALT